MIPSYKEMKKLALEHMKIFNFKIMNEINKRKIFILFFSMVTFILMMIVFKLMNDINLYNNDVINIVDSYGIEMSYLFLFIFGFLIIFNILFVIKIYDSLTKDNLNLIDYYFKYVYKGDD